MSSRPSSPSSPFVYWEDEPSRVRAIIRVCSVCNRFLLREYGRRLGYDAHIVSPAGTAHCQADYDEGYTACGKDATGLDWWWRV